MKTFYAKSGEIVEKINMQDESYWWIECQADGRIEGEKCKNTVKFSLDSCDYGKCPACGKLYGIVELKHN